MVLRRHGRRTTRRSTRSGTATRAAGRSPTRRCAGPHHRAARARRRRQAAGRPPGPRRSTPRPRGLAAARDAKGVGVLVGGRVSAEDAYAYSKFARVALQTNDIDFRARPHSVEEAQFLASHVVATGPEGDAVTYADLERARTVVLVGFEPEDESPIVFLRLRKAFRKNKTAVYAVAPFATRGLEKLGRHADPGGARHRGRGPRGAGRRRPRRQPTRACAAAAEALAGERALVLVGERLAGGARRAVRSCGPGRPPAGPGWRGSRAVPVSGARWRPARCPNLLPGGRPVTESAARAEVGEAWGVVGLPEQRRPRHRRDASPRPRAGRLGGLRGRRRRPGRPAGARRAAGRADAARSSSRSRCARARSPSVADVVLPVAAAPGEGRHVRQLGGPGPGLRGGAGDQRDERPPGAGPARRRDGGVPRAAHARRRARRHARARPLAGRPRRGPRPRRRPRSPQPDAGQAVLATWHHLLDAGRLQDGEPFLAGTAPAVACACCPPPRPPRSASARVTCSPSPPAPAGSRCRSPSTEMADHVVWLPTCSPGSAVRASLRRRRRSRRLDHQGWCRMSLLGLGRAGSCLCPMRRQPDRRLQRHPWWLSLVKALLIFVFLLVNTLLVIWFERRVIGRMQQRPGPNRAGPFGLLQTLADGVKLALKEDLTPQERRQGGLHRSRRSSPVPWRSCRSRSSRSARRSACSATARRCS